MSLSVTSGHMGSGNPPTRRRRSRGTGQRTRTGCFTCKRRRVKCDETKPACRRCTDFGRKCEGYPDLGGLSVTRKEGRLASPSTPLIVPSSAGSSRRSSFSSETLDIPEQYTRPTLPGYFAPGFWPELVERIAHSESAVQHALHALTTAHSVHVENLGIDLITIPGVLADQPIQEAALQEYNTAIAELARIMMTRDTRGTETILVCCFLFVCIEVLFDNQESAVQHAEAGLRVYRDWLESARPPQHTILIYSSTNSEYCIWRLAAELENFLSDLVINSALQVDLGQTADDTAQVFDSEVVSFESQEHVAGALVFMRRKQRRLAQATRASDGLNENLILEHQKLASLWKAFEAPYDLFMSSIHPTRVNRSILVLQIHYLTETMIHDSMLGSLDEVEATQRYTDILDTAVMLLRPIPILYNSPLATSRSFAEPLYIPERQSRAEMTYQENHEELLANTLTELHVPSLSLVGEIVPALLHTAKTPQTISVRQRALRLLYKCNAVEGIWNSRTCARQAEDVLTNDLSAPSSVRLAGL